jgi:hypothetical protein
MKSLNCGLYYKPMKIVNDDSRVVNKLKTSLTDDARVVIYDHHMFIVQATDMVISGLFHNFFPPKGLFTLWQLSL